MRAGGSRVRFACAETFDRWRREADERTLYLFDVRSAEEYEAGHLPGSRHAPGGQLVQATDSYAPVRGARIVLADDDGARASMTALWLLRMGWRDVRVLAPGAVDDDLETGPEPARVPGLTPARRAFEIDVMRVAGMLPAVTWSLWISPAAGATAQATSPARCGGLRSRMARLASRLPEAPMAVLTSPDSLVAHLAAPELGKTLRCPVRVLRGGTGRLEGGRLPAGDRRRGDARRPRRRPPGALRPAARPRSRRHARLSRMGDRLAGAHCARLRRPLPPPRARCRLTAARSSIPPDARSSFPVLRGGYSPPATPPPPRSCASRRRRFSAGRRRARAKRRCSPPRTPRFRASCAPTLRPPSPPCATPAPTWSSISATRTPPFAAFADLLQRETGIPVAAIDGRLARSGEALALLGRLTGLAARAEALAAEWERTRRAVAAIRANADRPRVHYAIGPGGERTARRGSIHLDPLDLVGAAPALDAGAGPQSRIAVDPAAVAAADPDLIVTTNPRFHARAASLEPWADLAAVRAGRVHLAPAPVLSWFDRPPSLNRIIGLRWLARLCRGDRYTGDLESEARAFHRLFYGVILPPDFRIG